MRRGDVFWVDFPEPVGSGPGFRRPALVIQCDPLNRSRMATVVVLTMTSNLDAAQRPTCVLVRAAESGLPKDSLVNTAAIYTVDKTQLVESAGHIAPDLMLSIASRLRQVLDL